MYNKKAGRFSYILFPLFLFIVILIALIVFGKYWSNFESKESLDVWLSTWENRAPLIFVLIQFFQVVIFVLPGELPQIAGGYIFGAYSGYLLSNIGIIAGSLFNYAIGKYLGVSFIKKIISEKKYHRFEYLMKSKNVFMPMFVLFIIPGIPKDALCYIAGLTKIQFLPFLFISLVGRAPGILMSSFFGDAAAEKNWFVAGLVSVLTVLMILAAFFIKKKSKEK